MNKKNYAKKYALENNSTEKEFYNKIQNIEMLIQKCKLCNLDKIKGENIYFGKNSNILLVGEAPAKNGWRITGKAWINEKGQIIPSGKILQKLLKNIGLDLFDLTFIELIKCFPNSRKDLILYANNCHGFFQQQIELLKPKVIITLGEIPTRLLLNDVKFKKLSDVVGRIYKYKNIDVIPIFHPSPISPKSFKGNEPIFNDLISKYAKVNNEQL